MTTTTLFVSVSHLQLAGGGDDEEIDYSSTDVKLINATQRYKELMVSTFGITPPHFNMAMNYTNQNMHYTFFSHFHPCLNAMLLTEPRR